MGIDEREKFQVNGINQIVNKIAGENSSKLRKDITSQVREAQRIPKGQGQKRKSPQHIIVMILSI